MDSNLLHKFLDIGISLYAKILPDQAYWEGTGFHYLDMSKEELDEIILAHVHWDTDDARALFEYVLDCTVQFGRPPNAFMLADLVYTRYKRRVDGKDDMAPTDSV